MEKKGMSLREVNRPVVAREASGEEEEQEEEEEEEDNSEVEEAVILSLKRSGGGSGLSSSRKRGGSSGKAGRRIIETYVCQVDDCTTTNLNKEKTYHQRHRVCESHARASYAIVAGTRQRFCQQCSRFHLLSQFDGVRRSCRQRLAEHNERRRQKASPLEPRPFVKLDSNLSTS